MENYSYLGSGKVYLKEAGSSAGLVEVGNCSALNFAVSEDVKKLTDYRKPGGGTYKKVSRISSVEVTMTLHDLSPDNLAKVLYGETTAVVAGAISNVVLGNGYIGAFLPFANSANSTPAPVIKAENGRNAVTRANSTAYVVGDYLIPATPNDYYYKVTTAGTSAGSPPTFGTTVGGTTTDGTATLTCMGLVTLVADTDYELVAGGIALLTGARFTDGESVSASYTKNAGYVVQALTQSGKSYEMYFAGLNEARSGKEMNVHAYSVSLGAAQNLALIGDDFAGLEVSGEVQVDTTKTGDGVSQYFKAEVQS